MNNITSINCLWNLSIITFFFILTSKKMKAASSLSFPSRIQNTLPWKYYERIPSKKLMLEIVWILRSTSASHTFFVANSFLFAPDLNYGCPIIDPVLLPAQPIFWVRLDILKTFYSFFYSCYTGVLGQKHIILVVDTHMLISSHPDCNVHAQLRS